VAAVRQTDPAAYLRVVSGLMPRDMLLRMEQAPVPPTEISPDLESLLRQVIDGVPKRRGIGVNAHAGEPRAPALDELLPDPIGQSKILN
jgi:hypothetical protein